MIGEPLVQGRPVRLSVQDERGPEVVLDVVLGSQDALVVQAFEQFVLAPRSAAQLLTARVSCVLRRRIDADPTTTARNGLVLAGEVLKARTVGQ